MMADKADWSVVMAQLQVAFLWECDNYGLSLCGLPLHCFPNLVADWGQDAYHGFSSCLDYFCWYVIRSSCLSNLQCFWLLLPLLLVEYDDALQPVHVSAGSPHRWFPISLIVVKVWAVLCPHIRDFMLSSMSHFPDVLYGCWFTPFLCCVLQTINAWNE